MLRAGQAARAIESYRARLDVHDLRLLRRIPRRLFRFGSALQIHPDYARAVGYPIQYQWTLLEGVNDTPEEIDGMP